VRNRELGGAVAVESILPTPVTNVDEPILSEIETLIEEERQLRSKEKPVDAKRLEALEVRLDQCWDLLRQRRAKREFGDNEGEAKLRPAGTVENYEN
jgi:DNA-binding transcriptional regulator PaaX